MSAQFNLDFIDAMHDSGGAGKAFKQNVVNALTKFDVSGDFKSVVTDAAAAGAARVVPSIARAVIAAFQPDTGDAGVRQQLENACYAAVTEYFRKHPIGG